MPDREAGHARRAVGSDIVAGEGARSPQSKDGRVRFEPGGIRPNTEPEPAPHAHVDHRVEHVTGGKIEDQSSDGPVVTGVEREESGEGAQEEEAGSIGTVQEPIELTPEELAAIVVCVCVWMCKQCLLATPISWVLGCESTPRACSSDARVRVCLTSFL